MRTPGTQASGFPRRDAPASDDGRRSLHDVVATPLDGAGPLTIDELLTAWLSSLHGSTEPDSFAEFGDYAKHVERLCRAQHAAESICRELDNRIADWVRVEITTAPVLRAPPLPRD